MNEKALILTVMVKVLLTVELN